MKKYLFFVIISFLIGSCLPGDMQVPQSPLLPFLERKAGRIAYIGADGNIYTSDQAGGDLIAHTDDAQIPEDPSGPYRYYVNPTWSYDSERLGFVRLSGQGNTTAAGIYVAEVGQETSQEVYSSKTEQPFYLYWSPDNTNLSFISSTAGGQSLILQSVSTERGERIIIDTGSPYYWSWAPDGKTMVVHSGSTQSSVPEHLAFLQVNTDIHEHGLESLPASFQAPAWSPDGSHVLMTRLTEENEKEIILTNGRGEFEKSIAMYELNTAFAWSHDSSMVGYIEGEQSLSAGTLGTLHVIDVETSESFFEAENVYGFFWSPDNDKIAYFVPMLANQGSGEQPDDPDAQAGQQLLLQVNILDVDRGESTELFTFRPTDQFAALMPYFDQYHQSATIWSPDSNNLVLSFVTGEDQPGIAVVPASGQLEPRLLAPGYLAFWSWE